MLEPVCAKPKTRAVPTMRASASIPIAPRAIETVARAIRSGAICSIFLPLRSSAASGTPTRACVTSCGPRAKGACGRREGRVEDEQVDWAAGPSGRTAIP